MNPGVLAAAIVRNQSTGGRAAGRSEGRTDDGSATGQRDRHSATDLHRRAGSRAARRVYGVAYQLVRDGVIPAHRIGRRWLIPRKALHEWLDNAPVG